MSYVKTFDRNQIMMCSWDMLVAPDSLARLINAFVDSLDMTLYTKKQPASEGRPSYDPASMYKLYIYGSRNGIYSSRKLAKACKVNIEVKWMIGGVEPDFRTISDFMKDNIDSLKKIFHEFNRRISGAVKWGFTSIDGSKFTANNSKNANFTKNKLDDRIQWLNAHTTEYLRILQEMDEQEDAEEAADQLTGEPNAEGTEIQLTEESDTEGTANQLTADPDAEGTQDLLTKELIEAKLKEAEERREKYLEYQRIMEETGASQMSLTDADARLMKSKNGFVVAFNPQTAVDSETHLIRDFNMTNQVTDHGQLMPTMKGIREESGNEILEVTADKGYEKAEDMIECLENGIIPHVIPDDGQDGYELELSYEEAEDADTTSTDPEELKKCLHAGKVPDAYKDVITDIEVKEVRRMVKEEKPEEDGKVKSIYGTPEEMMQRAKEGYYVRDPERNLVYCPNGEILRQKSIKKNGNIRYSNKNACKHCNLRNQCYKGKGEWKEIDFSKDCLEKPCKEWPKTESTETATTETATDSDNKEETVASEGAKKRKFEKRKIVKLFFKPSLEKMAKRMCLSEHPFGTIKRAMGASYFLRRGLRKVAGEFALFCLGYNIERAKNLLGFDKMMKLMTQE